MRFQSSLKGSLSVAVSHSSRLRGGLAVLSATCALAFVPGSQLALADERDREFEIRTLSTRAEMVSGGDGQQDDEPAPQPR